MKTIEKISLGVLHGGGDLEFVVSLDTGSYKDITSRDVSFLDAILDFERQLKLIHQTKKSNILNVGLDKYVFNTDFPINADKLIADMYERVVYEDGSIDVHSDHLSVTTTSIWFWKEPKVTKYFFKDYRQ